MSEPATSSPLAPWSRPAPRRAGRTTAWYERETCIVCRRRIGRLFFWNAKPRLVNDRCQPVAWRALGDTTIRRLLRTHSVVCDDCYRTRLPEVFAGLARRTRRRTQCLATRNPPNLRPVGRRAAPGLMTQVRAFVATTISRGVS